MSVSGGKPVGSPVQLAAARRKRVEGCRIIHRDAGTGTGFETVFVVQRFVGEKPCMLRQADRPVQITGIEFHFNHLKNDL